MKTKSLFSALAAMTLASALLTGCATGSSAPKESAQIYQPRVLQLQAGMPVPTKAGTYIPQTDEVWHSAAAYEEVESQLINVTAALAQERAR